VGFAVVALISPTQTSVAVGIVFMSITIPVSIGRVARSGIGLSISPMMTSTVFYHHNLLFP
jgi:hypothetical protein